MINEKKTSTASILHLKHTVVRERNLVTDDCQKKHKYFVNSMINVTQIFAFQRTSCVSNIDSY